MQQAFQIHPSDNVATLLGDAAAEPIDVLGAPAPLQVTLVRAVSLAHKVALHDIAPGESILKYGVPIGIATDPIRRGEWVHLHNCRSMLDERSSTLDVETGAVQDVPYE